MRLLIAACLLFLSAEALACSYPAYTLAQEVEMAEEIFVATLVEARMVPAGGAEKWPRIEGRFQVGRILKGGKQARELVFTTGLGRGDCGVGMSVSYKYIIFNERGARAIASPGGTRLIEDFQEDELVKQIQSIVRRQKGGPARKSH